MIQVVVRAYQFVDEPTDETEDNVVLYAALGAAGGVLLLGLAVFVLWKVCKYLAVYRCTSILPVLI